MSRYNKKNVYKRSFRNQDLSDKFRVLQQ